MEPGEARAVLRAIEGLLEQKEASDASVDEATRFFDAYDKLSRETAEKLRETQAALKRTELMVTLMVKVVRDCEDAVRQEKIILGCVDFFFFSFFFSFLSGCKRGSCVKASIRGETCERISGACVGTSGSSAQCSVFADSQMESKKCAGAQSCARA
jgi:hypothetical protein